MLNERANCVTTRDVDGIYSVGQTYFFHRAAAAFLALADLCFFVIFAARAFPPFNPPRRPSSTAIGSFTGGRIFGTFPVAWSTMLLPSMFTSVGLRERLRIAGIMHAVRRCVQSDFIAVQIMSDFDFGHGSVPSHRRQPTREPTSVGKTIIVWQVVFILSMFILGVSACVFCGGYYFLYAIPDCTF
jgi:hypothetical protein